MNTEQIMDLADEYADAENQDYLSGEGKADFYKTALQAAIEALVQERDAAQADAARYRWLREKTLTVKPELVRVLVMKRGQYLQRSGVNLDDAINAAMKGKS